jgi:pimeloyl-ACP methyl ester carboxylesterase
MQSLHERGYDAIATAMPGQDASPDGTVGFGKKEAEVIADTARWARQQYKERPNTILMGLSMGGAATWLASELVPDVDGVVTEGAYARFDEAMTNWFERRFAGASKVFRPVVWFATYRSKLHPGDVRPIDAAAAWKGRPALVIQGELDTLIPMSHATRLAEASGAELWVVPGATHAQGQDAGKQYVDRLDAFARRLR